MRKTKDTSPTITPADLSSDEVLIDLVMEARQVTRPRAKAILRTLAKKGDPLEAFIPPRRPRRGDVEEGVDAGDFFDADDVDVPDLSLSQFLEG